MDFTSNSDQNGCYDIIHQYNPISYNYNTDNNDNKVRILYLNTQSLKNKIDDIELMIFKYNPMIIILTETWLKQNEINYYNFNNFSSFHSVRDNNQSTILQKGGGVSVLVSESVMGHIIFEYKNNFNNVMGINIPCLNINIFGIYISNNPLNNIPVFLEELDKIMEKFKNSYLIGDMNINLLNENTLKQTYINIVQSNGFNIINKICPSMPTRKSSSNSPSILDHMITDLLQHKYILNIFPKTIGDHETLLLDIYMQKRIVPQKITYLKIDEPTIINEIFDTDFNNTENFDDFQTIITDCINRNKKQITINKKKIPIQPYLTQEILQMIKQKNKLNKLKNRYPNSYLFESTVLKSQNTIKNKTKFIKKQYYTEKIAQTMNDPRKLWNIIGEAIFNKDRRNKSLILPEKLNINNAHITNEIEILNSLNNYFINAVTWNNQISNLDEDLHISRLFIEREEFNFRQINEYDLKMYIKKINNNSASGYDLISPNLLKSVMNHINAPLLKITNNILSTSIFPNNLKIARVIPIYKAGNRGDPNNYRSVSILPSLSKPIEYIMTEQITEYIIKNDLIDKNQYGFVPTSNTTAACITLVSEIQKSLDNNQICACLSIDLRKAFDSIDHRKLIQKLRNLGFSYSATELIKDYLKNRQQFIKIGEKSSLLETIKTGVPQGAIIGPLLFNIFINDIFTIFLNGKLSMYADDGMIIYSATNISELERQMQQDITKLFEWFTNNSLQMNLTKTHYMIISRRPAQVNNIKILINNSQLQSVSEMKYLGLYINNTFTWNTHIINVKNKLAPFVNIIRRLNKFLPEKILTNIYFAHCFSKLIYLNSIWSSAPNYQIQQIRTIQNKLIKAIFNLPRLVPTITLYNSKFLNVDILKQFELITLFQKIRHNKIKHNMHFILNSDIHNYSTRNRSNIHISTIKTERYGRNGIIYQGITQYNNIPEELKQIANINQFKIELRKYLTSSN